MQKGRVRHGRGAYRALALAIAAAALTGCGSSGGSSEGTTRPGQATLEVREFDGTSLVRTIPLDCGTAGGPCDRVVDLLPQLAPDPGEVCAQVYGGPERRVIAGTVEGRTVEVEVTRTDGCQIARYDLLTAALEG